ncbi:hypothetical protein [Streptomyces coelicoflavus]|uniref:hypothetical protein n=1 Tax=Streptomyces coelicoflavus TaxID=285562 RepID=UPI00363EC9B2
MTSVVAVDLGKTGCRAVRWHGAGSSPSVSSVAGALGGRAGVVPAIGTGSVAVGIGADGTYARVDGWGPLLGDDGSGARIGSALMAPPTDAVTGAGSPVRLMSPHPSPLTPATPPARA